MGAADPIAAAKKIIEIATGQNIKIKVVAITGDDVLAFIQQHASSITDLENGKPLSEYSIISANAYMGCGLLQKRWKREHK